jgi:hypothetical protein
MHAMSHTCLVPVLQDDLKDWSKTDLSDPENWPSVSFEMHVHAYSGIGTGATFCVDFGSGTVKPVKSGEESRDEDNVQDEEVDSSDEGSEDIDAIARHRWDLMSDGEDSESADESDNDDDSMGEVVESEEGEGAWNEDPKKRFEVPPAKDYDPDSMVTRVQVMYHQPHGQIVGAKEVLKRESKQEEEDRVLDDMESPSTVIAKSVVAQALAMAHTSIDSGEVKIRSARSEMEEYELAVEWAQASPDEALHRPQGWARRANREDGMYGVTYLTDEYRKEIQIMFDEGAENSSKKMGPAEMLERLEEKFPGLYRYPGEIEISRAVSTMFDKQKKGKKKQTEKAEKLPTEVGEKIREIMARCPGQTGKFVEGHVARSFNTDLKIGEWTYNRKDVMAKVNAWNQQAKQKKMKEEKRLLIC